MVHQGEAPSKSRSTSADEIARQLRPFIATEQIVEIRVLNTKAGTVSGYFDDLDALARAAASWSGKAPAVYFTLNPVNPALLARAHNRLAERARSTTNDSDVTCRRWLFIDIDPVRPTGISSMNVEHQAALERARSCRDWLFGLGWPAPIEADSGNGGHLHYSIELPNDPEATTLLQRALQALAFQFDDSAAKVDVTTHNAARICKLYGTLSCKGDNVQVRPHRLSQVLSVPDPVVKVPRDLLEALAAMAPAREPSRPSANGHPTDFDLERWIAAHNLPVVSSGPWGDGGRKWILNPCPWNEDHSNRAAYIVQFRSGAIAAGCHHNGCQGKDWHALRDHYEPGWRERKTHESNGRADTQSPSPAQPQPKSQGDNRPRAFVPYQFDVIDSPTFAQGDYRQRWLLQRMLVRNQPALVGGPRKVLKTSLLVDMAISLGSGTPFLGEFKVYQPVRVAVLSGESGEHTLQETAKRICAARGLALEDVNVLWGFRLPRLAVVEDLIALQEGLKKHQVEVLIIDPLYLALLAGGGPFAPKPENLFDMGPLLLAIARTCLDVGVTPILIHHTKKGTTASDKPLELDDLAYSGMAEFARQWLLVSRRKAFVPGSGRHDLLLSAGGSAGHGGVWAVDVDEGVINEHFQGRIWDVRVTTHSEAVRADSAAAGGQKQDREKRKDREDDAKLLKALDCLAGKSPAGVGYTRVRAEARLSNDRMQRVVSRLADEGVIREVDVMVKIGSNVDRPARGLRRVVDQGGPSGPSGQTSGSVCCPDGDHTIGTGGAP